MKTLFRVEAMKMQARNRALDKIYKRRNRYEIPDWQRDEVWDKSKKQQLIDSILRGWRLPKFYFNKIGSDQYEVVDGQQRLSTIFEFYENKLALSKLSAKQFGGEFYRDLDADVSDAFDDYEIDYDEIENASEEELKQFFQRLQQGLPLTSSEKLNSVHSKLRDFCFRLSKHEFFKEKISVANTRYAHFDIASKVAIIEIEGLNAGVRFEDIKVVFEDNQNFPNRSAAAKNLQRTFDFLNEVFDSKSPLLRNRGVIQSIASLVARVIRTGKSAGREKKVKEFVERFMAELNRQVELGQFATDLDYLEFQRSTTANLKGGAKARHEILLRKLLVMQPVLADLFDPTIVAESGLRARITELSDSIMQLVADLNAQYSSKHGLDLFKPTNKTAKAQNSLKKNIRDLEGFKSLIDDLYFLFHESIGTRLNSMTPESFKHINAIRTELQHDVDHGKISKVRAKRKKLAKAFEVYSGSTSPYTYSQEKFPAVQASLLTAVEGDLRGLINKV